MPRSLALSSGVAVSVNFPFADDDFKSGKKQKKWGFTDFAWRSLRGEKSHKVR